MPNPPSDDDVYLYRKLDGIAGTQHSAPTSSAQAALVILQNTPNVGTAQAFIDALAAVLSV